MVEVHFLGRELILEYMAKDPLIEESLVCY